jgi:hypothetical protein
MKSKILQISFLICLSNNVSFSQDLINKTDGVEIKVKVVEIDDTNIKYKKFENQSGPVYSISKKDVDRIKYENGSIDNFSVDTEAPSATTTKASTGAAKFDINDENTVKQIEAIAKYAGETILSKCAGKTDNQTTEIYYDGVFQDQFTSELVIPIRIKWQPKNISGDSKWVRGTVKVAPDGRKTWSYQNDSGGWFGRCAKGMRDL